MESIVRSQVITEVRKYKSAVAMENTVRSQVTTGFGASARSSRHGIFPGDYRNSTIIKRPDGEYCSLPGDYRYRELTNSFFRAITSYETIQPKRISGEEAT